MKPEALNSLAALMLLVGASAQSPSPQPLLGDLVTVSEALERMPEVVRVRVCSTALLGQSASEGLANAVVISDRAEIATIKRACLTGQQGPVGGTLHAGKTAVALFEQKGGRAFQGFLFVQPDEQLGRGAFLMFGGPFGKPNHPRRMAVGWNRTDFDTWSDRFDRCQERMRQAMGMAEDLDALAALPADSQSICCPCLSVEQMRSHLPRFKQLQRLAFLRTANSSLPRGRVVDALASIATLEALELPADLLGEQELKALAGMTQLKELRLTGEWNGTARQLAGLRSLHTLELDIKKMPAGLDETLRGLPRLTYLSVHGPTFGDKHLPAVLTSKVSRLHLSRTSVSVAGLESLAELASLRRLRLSGNAVSLELLTPLGALSRLESLYVQGAFGDRPDALAERLAELRKELPGCRIEHLPYPTQDWRKL